MRQTKKERTVELVKTFLTMFWLLLLIMVIFVIGFPCMLLWDIGQFVKSQSEKWKETSHESI